MALEFLVREISRSYNSHGLYTLAMASNQSYEGATVSLCPLPNPTGISHQSMADHEFSPIYSQAIDSLRKLETDAETLRREAHHMGEAELLRNEQALERRLLLVSHSHAAITHPLAPQIGKPNKLTCDIVVTRPIPSTCHDKLDRNPRCKEHSSRVLGPNIRSASQ